MFSLPYDAKSIRLDVYVEDGNRVFNLEMQTVDRKDLPRRSRYYQGLIVLNIIEKGESYKKLKDSFVIFICTFDPFDRELPEYFFENICHDDMTLKLNDGTRKVFYNSTAYSKVEDDDVRAFLKYVNGESSDNPFVQELESKVKQVKANKEWRLEYMTLLMREQEIREDAREAALAEARVEEIKSVVDILRTLEIPDEAIIKQLMKKYQLSEDDAEAYVD